MRLKFILVGFVLALFVFPYVLNIGESSAEGLGCPKSLGIGEKIRCLESTLREQNVIVRNLEKSIAESGQARVVLSSQLNDCRMDSPSTNLGPRSSNAIPVFWGLPKTQNTDCKSQWNNSKNKAKILANVENAINLITIPGKHYLQEVEYARDNIAAIRGCANAYPSGC